MDRAKQKINRIAQALATAWVVTACALLPACSTGIESTRKVTLSKEDKQRIEPSPDDTFLPAQPGDSLPAWQPGKQFMAADNRTALIFSQAGLPVSTDSLALKGKTITYRRAGISTRPDERDEIVVEFNLDGMTLLYPTAKYPTEAAEIISSDIPMLIDLDMVGKVSRQLVGKQLWTRTGLWYAPNGDIVPGRKFVSVTIDSVNPGDIAFPIYISFHDDRGARGMMMMSYSRRMAQSRPFSSLFSLSDPRKQYESISDEKWKCIQEGRVIPYMTKEECRLSLGNPTAVDTGHDYNKTIDVWQYGDGRFLYFEDGLLQRFKL